MGTSKMKITADTNVLIRAAVLDEPHQARRAAQVLQQADVIAVPVPALCQFVWVLRRGCKKSGSNVSDAIRRLMKSINVVMGNWLGEEEFFSFEANAVSLLQSQGIRALCRRNWRPVSEAVDRSSIPDPFADDGSSRGAEPLGCAGLVA